MQCTTPLRGVCRRATKPRSCAHLLRAGCPSSASSISRPSLLRIPALSQASVRRAPLHATVASLHTSRLCRAPCDVPAELSRDIREIIEHDRLVVFLTGTPEQPRCRFTVQLVDLFNQLGIKYSFFNILDDEEVCEGLKTYSDWPTYPQVYIDGELLGGYDICKSMMLDGSLTRTFKEKELM